MATNDFLAAGGDGYDMLGGKREEGPSLDTIFIDHLKQGTNLRLYNAATTIDLAQYKEAFPGERIISISEAEFNKKNKPEPVPTPDPKDPTKTKPDEVKVAKPAGKTADYPKMGETIVAYGSLGSLIIGLSGYGLYDYNRKQKIG